MPKMADDVDGETEVEYFGCHAKESKYQIKIVICIICGTVYHRSCVTRKTGIFRLERNFIICCNDLTSKLNKKELENKAAESKVDAMVNKIKDYKKAVEELSVKYATKCTELDNLKEIMKGKEDDELDNDDNCDESNKNYKLENKYLKHLLNEVKSKCDALNESNFLLREKLANKVNSSYASVTANKQITTNTQPNNPAIIVTGMSDINLDEKYASVRKTLADKAIVPIEKVILTKKNIIVKCKNESDVLETEKILKKCVNDVNVSVETRKNPLVRVVNVIDNIASLNDDKIIEDISIRNNLVPEGISIKYKYFNNTTKKGTLVMELSSDNYERIMNYRKIYFKSNRHQVYDDFNINPCYKCCKYGHSAKQCRNNICCKYCSDEHDSRNCTNTGNLRCKNCLDSNHRYNMKLRTTHSAFDRKACVTYKHLVKRVIQATNYPYSPFLDGGE